ncbi:MAG: WD40 repeat domain-containing protein, partial [Deltaproteobacteria bacterium]
FALAFSLTDATVAAADRDVVRLWSVRDEKPIDWQGHGGPVRAVAWSRDGALLASAGSDGTVRLWNPGQRRELALCRGHAGAVNAVALPPDGRTVVSGGDDGAIVVFDIESGEVRTRLAAHQGPVHHLAFGHDGDVLISSGEDGRVRLWRGGTGGERILVALPSAGASDDAPEVRDPAAPSQGDGAPGQKE